MIVSFIYYQKCIVDLDFSIEVLNEFGETNLFCFVTFTLQWRHLSITHTTYIIIYKHHCNKQTSPSRIKNRHLGTRHTYK